MPRPIVTLEVPEAWFTNPYDGSRHQLFYTSILAGLAEIGALIDPIWLPRGAERARRPAKEKGLVISFHSYGIDADHILRCKESYIPPFYSFDPKGYACFSKLASDPDHYADRIEAIDQALASRFVRELAQNLRHNNISKYAQPVVTADDPVSAESGYVFVPLQLVNDSVADGAWLSAPEALPTIVAAAARRGMRTIIKRHPRCEDADITHLLKRLSEDTGVVVSTGSIHTLIDGAALVIGANSGVLFEALMQGKPVISYAQSDYGSITHQVSSPDALSTAIATPLPGDPVRRDKFLYWYLNDYCVHAGDVPAIRRKITQALKPTLSTASSLETLKYHMRLYTYAMTDRLRRRFF